MTHEGGGTAHARGRRQVAPPPLLVAFAALSLAVAATVVSGVVKERRLEWRLWQARFRALQASTPGTPNGGNGVEEEGIQQIWLPDLDRVDRCTSCHLGIAAPEMRAAPLPFRAHVGRWLETHRPDRFGCTSCHGGQGEATAFLPAAHRPIPFWPEPMVTPELMDARCGTCHKERRPRGTYWLARGRQRVADSNCVACHEVPGYDARDVRAPRLDGIERKVSPAWLRVWLADPKTYLPRSRMGNFRLSAQDIEALAAFLLTPREAPRTPAPAVEWARADPERGGQVFRRSRCVTCHEVSGRGGTLGPALTGVGSKTSREWLFGWISDPSRMQPRTLMPRFRLTEEEVGDLAAYLSGELRVSLPEEAAARGPDPGLVPAGRAIFERRGCYSCHELSGFPSLARIGPKLNAIGDRVVDRAPLEARGIAVTLPNWIFAKLRGPEQVLKTARMPTFGFDETEAAAVTVALLSLRAREMPPERVTRDPLLSPAEPQGEFGALVRRYRCLSCHRLLGGGGTLSPVALDRIGSQLRKDYLAKYIANPVAVRVAIPERMPHLNVTPDEARRLAEHLSSVLVDDALEQPVALSTEAAKRGRRLFDERGCRACHIVGDTGGYVGPDLNGSGRRLKPAWTVAFLLEPERWKPGTLQPEYDLAPEDARALTAYVLSLPPRVARAKR
jgi:sulfur oxidation c-type cytochrome SoxX